MNLEKILIKNEINLPKYWDTKEVIEILISNDSTELPVIFNRSSAGLQKILKACIPHKPDKQAYSKYFKDIMLEEAPATDISYTELYQLSPMAQIRYINSNAGFDKQAYAEFKEDYCQYD